VTKSVFSARYRAFRRLLKESRQKSGVTQEQLAKKIGWSQTDVSKAERGERRLDVVEFLIWAKAIGVDAAKFVESLERSK
jgi:transcriptional regulator with XRE-family HTH domain